MKRYIRAQAMSKSSIGDRIESQTLPVMEALAQLYLFPHAQDTRHWRKEVWANLFTVPITKKSHKPPSASFILENTWYLHQDEFEAWVEAAIEHKDSYTPDSSRVARLDVLYDLMEQYFIWLAEELSSKKTLKSTEIYKKLDELGL